MHRLTAITATTTMVLTLACETKTLVVCEEDPTWPSCVDGAVATDGETPDSGGEDGGPPPDAGPCGAACTDPTPLCRETDDTCVACLADTDCTDPAAARCDTTSGACVACDDSAQCAGIPGTEICATAGDNTGSCVECTEAETGACGGNPCNPLTNACSGFPAGMTGTCESCDTDANCRATDARCVALDFMGTDRGGYCLPEVPTAGACPRPYRTVLADIVSLSGAASASYCGIDESRVTCEAIRSLGLTCDMCTGVDAARCEDVPGQGMVCTYSCASIVDCPDGGAFATCDTGAGGFCGS